MPLTTFGAIMTFAESIESADAEFYEGLAAAGTDLAGVFAPLAKESRKNVKVVQRLRREFATEMILEPIQDFTRAAYELTPVDPAGLDMPAAKDAGQRLEQRAVDFYTTAAQKLTGLPEVGRDLKRLGKKHKKRLDGLV